VVAHVIAMGVLSSMSPRAQDLQTATLRGIASVTIVVDLAVHKQPEVRATIDRVGAHIRFLPPYSPEFNPIELAFAKLQAFLRAARPRSFDHVSALIATALGFFTPTECRNYVRHCGYRVATAK